MAHQRQSATGIRNSGNAKLEVNEIAENRFA